MSDTFIRDDTDVKNVSVFVDFSAISCYAFRNRFDDGFGRRRILCKSVKYIAGGIY